ncbi:MAG: homocysteine S-methyltransferase [Chloroflexota bacterium]
MIENPLAPFLEQQPSLILDGGLATELERRGFDLDDPLWSARLLSRAPEAIKAVHLDYLAAGADCIITASYQATIPGFRSKGYSAQEARTLIRRAVLIAREARDEFWSQPQNRRNRLRPLVAASVGPYGAFLADGSEYRGDYSRSEDELYAFHRPRWRLLVDCEPDILACETIPSAIEALALARLLIETPEMPAWVSFSCRDGRHINDGAPLADVVKFLTDIPTVVALGINCTPPRFIPDLVREARRATDKPIVVYPNSGEVYDVKERRWTGLSIPDDFAEQSRAWREAGATLIGGCCRTGPDHISQIRRAQLQTV